MAKTPKPKLANGGRKINTGPKPQTAASKAAHVAPGALAPAAKALIAAAAPSEPGKAGERTTGLPVASAWPADKVERWPVEALVPYARNARTHSPDQVGELARSIKTFGWTMPVLVDEDGVIIAGHGRVMAAQQIGLTEVPVMIARGWTDAQKRAYGLADNKLAMNAGWDAGALREELLFLGQVGVDPALMGFNDVELVTFLAAPPDPNRDPNKVPDLAPPVSRLGDLWLLGANVQCPNCQKLTPLHAAYWAKP